MGNIWKGKNRLPFVEKYERQSIDWILEIAAATGLLAIVLLVLFKYGSLPAEIPMHFNALGLADAWAEKANIFGLPAISVFTYFILFSIRFFPQKINFPVALNEKNAAFQYKLAMRMLLMLNTILMFVFLYITWSIIQMAGGLMNGLGSYFLPLTLLLVFGAIGIYLLIAVKHP